MDIYLNRLITGSKSVWNKSHSSSRYAHLSIPLQFFIVLFCTATFPTYIVAQSVTQTFTVSGAGTFTVPANVTSLTIECWGGGGPGGAERTAA